MPFSEMEPDSTTTSTPGTSVMSTSSTGAAALAQAVGHSERGDAYRRITDEHDGKPVVHDCLCPSPLTSHCRNFCAPQFVCTLVVRFTVPRGVGVGVSFGTRPPGGAGKGGCSLWGVGFDLI